MHKRLAIVAVLLVLTMQTVFADIGENFAKGGIGLSGSVSVYDNFYYFADPAEQRKFWSIDVTPSIEYFVVDRIALQLSPWFHYESYTSSKDNVDRYVSYGARVGANFALFLDPTAQQGLAVTVGGLLGLNFYPTVDDLVAGVETPNNYNRTDIVFIVTPRVYYFLNDRLAAFIGITPQLSYVVSYNDPTGTAISLTGQQRLHADVTITVGIAFFIPNKNASILLNN
jgi:hypothetical protein